MKTLTLFALLFSLWPHKFFFAVREVAHLRFRTGDQMTAPYRSVDGNFVQLMALYRPSGRTEDISRHINNTGDSVRVPLGEEGTYMVVFNSADTLLSLSSEEMRSLRQKEGLPEMERKNGKPQIRVRRQQSMKTIFAVGMRLTDACLSPTALPLEIVPAENPYTVPLGTDRTRPIKLRFQVLYQREPVADVLVKRWYRNSNNQLQADSARSNKRGWVSFSRQSGPNLLSCTYMFASADNAAEWQQYSTSLSCEYSVFVPGKSGMLRTEP